LQTSIHTAVVNKWHHKLPAEKTWGILCILDENGTSYVCNETSLYTTVPHIHLD